MAHWIEKELSRIRYDKASHYFMIRSWWMKQKQMAPDSGMMPDESTFIWIWRTVPVFSVSLILTNTHLAWIENLVANPDFRHPDRGLMVDQGMSEVMEMCKQRGLKKVFCMSVSDKTDRRFKKFGFMPSAHGVTTMVKEI